MTRKPLQRKPQSNVKPDYSLLLLVLILLGVGLVMVYEASVVDAFSRFDDAFHFVKLQLKWALIGLGSMLFVSRIALDKLKKLTVYGFAGSLLLLVLVLLPGLGNEVKGASRWLDLGVFSFQPSELIKLTMIFYFSALFEKTTKLKPFVISLAVVVGLVMLQPDLGTTLVIGLVAISLYFLAGAPLLHLLALTTSAITAVSILIFSSSYRRDRFFTFLDPDKDPLGTSYHIRQIIIALGSGGIFGKGIGRSMQRFRYLPEATTDSIFAVFAEEVGFVGTLVLISLYLAIAYKGLSIAANSKDRFSSLLASGVTLLIISQAFLNLSAMGALVPLTGITLPLVSYGGSSLVTTLIGVGILLNLSRYTKTGR